jgi:hypothetical protein
MAATFLLSNDGHAGLCGRQGCISKDKPDASRSTNGDGSSNKVTQGEAVIPSMRVLDEEIARARGSYIRSSFPNKQPAPVTSTKLVKATVVVHANEVIE